MRADDRECVVFFCFFLFQAEDGIRDRLVTGVQTCALPIFKYEPFVIGSTSAISSVEILYSEILFKFS